MNQVQKAIWGPKHGQKTPGRRPVALLAPLLSGAMVCLALGLPTPSFSQQSSSASKSGQSQPKAAPAVAPKPAAKPAPKQSASAQKDSNKKVVRKDRPTRSAQARASAPTRVSMGSRLGLRSELSEIALNSSAVLVLDQNSGEVLLEKNPDVVLPIASITKLMTAVVTLDADLSLDEIVTITAQDTRLEKYSSSRLRVGSKLSRGELLHLALMSSENRAAHALGRTYPGGMTAFVAAMNEKARSLGMTKSNFVEPTGLSSSNVSSPRDLAALVDESHAYPQIRAYSTAKDAVMSFGGKALQFRNTNALARGHDWDIGVSKTGFISDAGRCLVMQAVIDDQPVIMVMLDAEGKAKRLSDAERIRRWLSSDRDRQPPRS